MTSIDSSQLRAFVAQVLAAAGATPANAEVVADNLVFADLRGTETHGVIRLDLYLDRIEAGGLDPRANCVEVSQAPAAALLDGGNGFGAVGGAEAMRLACDKAEQSGIGWVTVRRTNHFGAAGYFAMQAIDRGMVGLAITNVCASMAPTGGTLPIVGNNPIAIGCPGSTPVVWDVATSMSSWGALIVAGQRGLPLPAGAFLGPDGAESTDPATVLAGGSLLPIAGYKGYGLAMMIALLTGVLAGAPTDPDIPHPYRVLDTAAENSASMLAIDLRGFGGAAAFTEAVDAYSDRVHEVPATGTGAILLPGEREQRISDERSAAGIPLADATVEMLRRRAAQYGVPVPAALG